MSAGLPAAQLAALLACIAGGVLRRTRGGYRSPQPGVEPMHSTRSLFALTRDGLLQRTQPDSDSEFAPTQAGRDLAAASQRKAA